MYPFFAHVGTRALTTILFAGGAAALHAQSTAIPLDQVVVKGQALRGANAPFSVDALDTARIRYLRVSHPEELFKQVPGMAVRNLGLSGVADSIVMRGFGGGGHGGDLGVVIDGIPLNEAMSHADGYVDLNVVVPLEIGAMTVYKGPVSALYGNYNRSGLIALETRKDGPYGNADVSIANNDTIDAQAALGLALGGAQRLNFAGQHYRTTGFRPQSDFDRTTLAGRWALEVSPAVQVSLAGRYYTGSGDSASYITRQQYERDPYGIDPRVQLDGSERGLQTLRADGSFKVAERLKLLAFAYHTDQSFTRWYTRPINTTTWAQREESYDREVTGGGLNLNGQQKLGAGPLNWVTGVEAFRESTYYQFADGLNNRRRLAPAIYDRTADLNSVSAFAEVEAPLHARFKPWVAARYDRFTGEATRNGTETGTDPLGKMKAMSHLSPTIGVRSDVAPGVRLRASWAEGFALAPNFVKYALGAGNLDPNVFQQTEIGAAFQLARTVAFDIAVYRIDSSDEILTVSPGVYQNFGETKRTGFEAKGEWCPLNPLAFTLTYGSAESDVERNTNLALTGKKVTGVPDHTGTFLVAWAPQQGWGADAMLRYVGSYAVDATNTLYSPSYTTIDVALSYAGRWGNRRYKVYSAIENVADRVYATSVSLISGFQILAPGAPLTFKAGVQFDF